MREDVEEREKDLRRKVLIVKRGAKANRACDMEKWVRKVLGGKQVRVIRAISNKDAAKVFFASEKEKEEVWERKEMLRKEEDMMIDRWLNIEERKERYRLMERTSSLKEEYRRKGYTLTTKIDEGRRRKERGDHIKEWEIEREREKQSTTRGRKTEERRERMREVTPSRRSREKCRKCSCGGSHE